MAKNIGKMLKQVQKMQREMMKMQEEAANKEYTATAGGGMVKAVVNGKNELTGLTIEQEIVDPEDVEMLQDLIVAAVNEAMNQAKDDMQKGMAGVTGNLGIDLSSLGM